MSPVGSPEAPTHTPRRPGEPPITGASNWHKGARTTYATNCTNRQAEEARGFAPRRGRAYCSGHERASPAKGPSLMPPKASPPPRVARAPRGPIEGRRDREHIRTVVVPDHDDLALRLDDRIVEIITRETAAKGRCVLGLATGSTPLGIYRELIRRHQAGDVDLSRVVTFNLDEYYPMPPDSPHSYRRYMWENLFAHVNIRPEQVHIPDGGVPRETLAEHCAAYERAIAEAGGIDFQMLGIGKSGHIGFNEPGSSSDERTRLVTLDTVTRKAILKRPARDYTEHHLSPLLSKHGAAGPINGAIFNRLRDKIRGRRKLPTRKSVVVFSPHPDDDVISMGGLLRKLWENENATVVAYMTSGNIAVFDHDVRRHLDFVERAATTLGLERAAAQRVREEVEASFERKAPGDVDLPAVQELKRVIRESEAVAALEEVGLPPTAARFLNLPFYRTGQVRKHPIGPEDVRVVRALLVETRPDLVFVAGDLSDPHGTHRMCRAAVAGALEEYDAAPPEVWLYRGAWQEWSLTEADVLVPLSQDELRAKVLAIFKHQSQKDTAPFPGGHDDREFWQRVEARNLETAARADRLGLPEYFAMEAYRILTPKEAER